VNANRTQPMDPNIPKFSSELEWAAFDSLPPEMREVIRTAPFEVSVAEMMWNRAVVRALEQQGANAPTWLSEQLSLTYRKKFTASS
jgi:hypothetical protein